MKRFVICLGLCFGVMVGMSGTAQADQWTSCGATTVKAHPDKYVWVTGGKCNKAVATIRQFFNLYAEFPNDGATSLSFGQTDCDFDPAASRPRVRCESAPMLILGFDSAGTDPNHWKNPPAKTPSLTAKRARAMTRAFLAGDIEELGKKERMKVSCETRLSRLSFRCHYSWFASKFHIRGTTRVTRTLHGSRASFSTRFFNRKCLRAGGSLKKCELLDE